MAVNSLSAGLYGCEIVALKPVAQRGDTGAERCGRLQTQGRLHGVRAAGLQEGAVGVGTVKHDLALVADHILNEVQRVPRCSALGRRLDLAGQGSHTAQPPRAGRPPRRSHTATREWWPRVPQHHLRGATGVGLVELAQQGRQRVRPVGLKMLARSVQVDENRRDGVEGILPGGRPWLASRLPVWWRHSYPPTRAWGRPFPTRSRADFVARLTGIRAAGDDIDVLGNTGQPGRLHGIGAHQQIVVVDQAGIQALISDTALVGGRS